ncbi:hypothetical protein DXT63_02795, partial [Thermoanaerobacteraceae bacterium SP2]
ETWEEDHSRTSGEKEEKHTRYAWLSSRQINHKNVFFRCTKIGRYRWKIENNILVEKHQGYEYEHCFSYSWNAMKGFHYLMKIGHFLNVLALNSELLADKVKELGIRGFIKYLTLACEGSVLDKNRVNVLIIGDSIYSRNRSKVVEILARVRDHVAQKYVKGFRLLTLGWSDGNTFIPLGFNLLSAQTSENRLQPMNSEIDKRSIGYKRRISSLAKETDAMIDLLKQAVENNIPAKYVLFDSWFTYPSILLKILGLNLHVIAMVKGMKKIYYSFQGKRMSLQSIYSCVRKKRGGKAKILSSVVVGIGTDNDGNEVLAKIVFVRDRNRSRNWLAIISTDTTLSDEEIIRIYGKRWDIEIFFKICKSYLNLAKEFQGRSYDSIVAHTTIVFARYIMLAVENRNNKDLRTIGGLFYYFCDELQDIKFIEALQLLIDALKTALREKLVLSKEAISEFLDYFMSCLPTFLKEKLALCSCES